MKTINRGRIGCHVAIATTLILMCASGAMPQGAMAGEQAAIWKQARKQTLSYIEKMPEAAIGFKPTPEVRSFSGQMAHLAYWNFAMFAGLAGKANPHDGKEQSLIDGIKTKAELTKFVTES